MISVTSLYALSTPSVANALRNSLPRISPLSAKQIQALHRDLQSEPTAIVIVGAGRKTKAPEYTDVDTVNADTLELLRYGAFLHRKTLLPILLVGGSPNGESTPEAVLMNQVLTQEFNVEVSQLIPTTLEDPQFQQQIPKAYKNWVLVTRSSYCLHDWPSSIQVLCSPVDPKPSIDPMVFLPSLNNLVISHQALREAFRI
jgi:hypothetical protein